ncbi:MAG: hypothetical protein LUC91_02130, partial [Prevotella sp.]|nr:hypothetical protein [Prevotella sp.]
MKKILLGAFALFAAMTVNAQEIIAINADEVAQLQQDDGTILGGTEIGATENLSLTVKFTDTYKSNALKYGLSMNGEDIEDGYGIQGSTNGAANGKEGQNSTVSPIDGCIYAVTPEKDGYVYFIHKPSYNKNYIVFEATDRIPYFFSMYDPTANVYGEYNLSYGYTDSEGNVASYWNDEYSEWILNEDYPILRPEDYDTGLASAPSSSCIGVIAFPVIGGQGYEYLCYATGSKISLGYVIFSEEDNITITTSHWVDSDKNQIDFDSPVTIYEPGKAPSNSGSTDEEGSGEEGSEGINNVTINLDSTGAIYNIAGQRLSTMGKGINVVNG